MHHYNESLSIIMGKTETKGLKWWLDQSINMTNACVWQ